MRKIHYLALAAVLLGLGCTTDDSPTNNDNNGPELTAIPDTAFEQALIDIGVDTELNGTVPTSAIANVTDLVFNDRGISSMQGLEDFPALVNLWLNDNMLTQLNISANTNLKFVYAENNSLTALNVGGLNDLEKIGMSGNDISIMNVQGNSNLQLLELVNNNISSLDVSNNNALNRLYVQGNPLTCIKVNATQLADIPIDWEKDQEDIYDENCTQ